MVRGLLAASQQCGALRLHSDGLLEDLLHLQAAGGQALELPTRARRLQDLREFLLRSVPKRIETIPYTHYLRNAKHAQKHP